MTCSGKIPILSSEQEECDTKSNKTKYLPEHVLCVIRYSFMNNRFFMFGVILQYKANALEPVTLQI